MPLDFPQCVIVCHNSSYISPTLWCASRCWIMGYTIYLIAATISITIGIHIVIITISIGYFLIFTSIFVQWLLWMGYSFGGWTIFQYYFETWLRCNWCWWTKMMFSITRKIYLVLVFFRLFLSRFVAKLFQLAIHFNQFFSFV